ncbi:MAG: aminotransferase class I/II-fold pyridoxal phosphate-dependent enzyme [Minicystis sp.]
MLKRSARSDISPFIVMDVMEAAARREAAGDDVLHLEVGQPSTPAPQAVIAAAAASLQSDKIGYSVALGIPALRQRVARHYRETYRVDVSPEQVAITNGSSGGFVLAFLAAFDAGDRVVVTSPGYPCYRNILSALGIEVVEVPVGAETRFQPTPEVLADVAGRIDGLVVASPANPTGTVIGSEDMRRLGDYCRARGVRIISDEIYHGITYGATSAVSALEHAPEAIVVNSFSKYFSMTGWRLGWLVLPAEMVRAVERLAQNLFICAPTLSQLGGVAAFDCYPELDAHVRRYAANREILLERLPRMGIGRTAPADGAFYVHADVSHLTSDSPQLCRRLLEETGVAITPGIDFDPRRGRSFIRFSYSGGTPQVTEAMNRLERWLGAR